MLHVMVSTTSSPDGSVPADLGETQKALFLVSSVGHKADSAGIVDLSTQNAILQPRTSVST